MLEHECAAALPADHQVFGGQRADGLARRALADTEFGCDLELVGDELARLPAARADALEELGMHLGIERSLITFGGVHFVLPFDKTFM